MKQCVILVGHGATPSDCPAELVIELKRLERASAGRPTPQFLEVDSRIRAWPRNPQTDPYQAGLAAIAQALRLKLKGRLVLTAYNEFCAPTLEESFAEAVRQGAQDVTVISTMYTRGGVHSEKEIPHALEALRRRYPQVSSRYAWPFDLNAVADLLSREIERAQSVRA